MPEFFNAVQFRTARQQEVQLQPFGLQVRERQMMRRLGHIGGWHSVRAGVSEPIHQTPISAYTAQTAKTKAPGVRRAPRRCTTWAPRVYCTANLPISSPFSP